MPDHQRDGDRPCDLEIGAPRPVTGDEHCPRSDLTRLVERLGSSLERRRARTASARPQLAARARASLATLPADCAPLRTDTDAALRAALAKLQEINVPQ
jgi:hypothetical protein